MPSFSWLPSRSATQRFLAGFFEGPRMGSTGEPLRDDWMWCDAPQPPALEDDAESLLPPDPELAGQLVALNSSIGDSIGHRSE